MAEEHKRGVYIAPEVRVVFKRNGAEESEEKTSRDVYSVMDAILSRIAASSSNEDLGTLSVSVHSIEDTSKSDPLPEGEQPFEGPYLVAGSEIEDMRLQDAVSVLSGLIIPSDMALRNMERLCSQLFLRTRMDGCVFVVSADGSGMSTTVLNPMRDLNPGSIRALYRTLLRAADELRRSMDANFPDMRVDYDSDGGSSGKAERDDRGDKDGGGGRNPLVLPSGLPASLTDKGVVTPSEIRASGPKMVRLY